MGGAPTPHLTPPQPQSKTQITTYGHVWIPPFQNNSRMDFHTFHTWSVIPVTRVTQRTLFCGAKNEKMAPQAKKFKIQDATQFPRCISWKEIYCLRQIYFLGQIYFLREIYCLREIYFLGQIYFPRGNLFPEANLVPEGNLFPGGKFFPWVKKISFRPIFFFLLGNKIATYHG